MPSSPADAKKWAKKHPAAAAAIGLGGLVAVYLIAKHGQAGGADSGGTSKAGVAGGALGGYITPPANDAAALASIQAQLRELLRRKDPMISHEPPPRKIGPPARKKYHVKKPKKPRHKGGFVTV